MSNNRRLFISILFQCFLFEYSAQVQQPHEECIWVDLVDLAMSFRVAAELSEPCNKLAFPSNIYISQHGLDQARGVKELIKDFNNQKGDGIYLFPYIINPVDTQVQIPFLSDSEADKFHWMYAAHVPPEYQDDIAITIHYVRTTFWNHPGSKGKTTKLAHRSNAIAVVKYTRTHCWAMINRTREQERTHEEARYHLDEARLHQNETRPRQDEARMRQDETRPRFDETHSQSDETCSRSDETRSRSDETRSTQEDCPEDYIVSTLNAKMERLQGDQMSSEYRVRQAHGIRKRVQDHLNDAHPGHQFKVQLFGSFANGLSSNSSDVDLVVQDDSNFLKLKTLAKALRNRGYREVVPIYATVPIVRFMDPLVHISCDMTINEGLGLENSRLIHAYQSIDHRVPTIWFTLKQIARTYMILSPRNGLLSSYALALMLITYLQSINPPVLPKLQQQNPRRMTLRMVHEHNCTFDRNWSGSPTNPDTPAELLLTFLSYFGNKFDYAQWEVNPKFGRIGVRQPRHVTGPISYVAIRDPFDMTRNVAGNVGESNARKIKNAFQDAHLALTDDKWPQATNTSF